MGGLLELSGATDSSSPSCVLACISKVWNVSLLVLNLVLRAL